MYEGWKKEVLRRVEKNFDKEINDTRSWTMEEVIYIEGIERNSNIDNVIKDYLICRPGIDYHVPTKTLLNLFNVNELRKETPKHILKANLLKRYWHHYFKKYYNTILEEVK